MSTPEKENAADLDVVDVAHLARLKLSDAEVATFQGQLAQVVAYVHQLKELDLTDIEPTSHAHPVRNVMREDEVQPSLEHDRVMANAPASKDGQFIVPKIVE